MSLARWIAGALGALTMSATFSLAMVDSSLSQREDVASANSSVATISLQESTQGRDAMKIALEDNRELLFDLTDARDARDVLDASLVSAKDALAQAKKTGADVSGEKKKIDKVVATYTPEMTSDEISAISKSVDTSTTAIKKATKSAQDKKTQQDADAKARAEADAVAKAQADAAASAAQDEAVEETYTETYESSPPETWEDNSWSDPAPQPDPEPWVDPAPQPEPAPQPQPEPEPEPEPYYPPASNVDLARAILSEVGFGWIPVYASDCDGVSSEACAYSDYIGIGPLFGSNYDPYWTMVHEAAHVYSYSAGITNGSGFYNLFGGDWEDLANCMAAAYGYGWTGAYSQAQLDYANGVWSGYAP